MKDSDKPSLGLRIELTREAYYNVVGSLDALQSVATELSRAVAEYPDRENPLGIDTVCSFPVLPYDRVRKETYLSFEVASDLSEHYSARTGLRGFLAEWGGCLRVLLFGTLSAIGLWTLISWIFQQQPSDKPQGHATPAFRLVIVILILIVISFASDH